MTDCQLIPLWLTHRYRGQAPSHIGFFGAAYFFSSAEHAALNASC